MYLIGVIKMRSLWSNAALRFAQPKTLDKTRTEQISLPCLQKSYENFELQIELTYIYDLCRVSRVLTTQYYTKDVKKVSYFFF